MNKKLIFKIIVVVLVLITIVQIIRWNIGQNNSREDISKYNITDKYGCEQIQNEETRENCVKFYEKKYPLLNIKIEEGDNS